MTPRRGVAVLHGEIDMNSAEQVTAECLRALDSLDGPRLVVDVSDVSFIDSSGIQALLEVRRKAAEREIGMALLGAQRNVVRTLTILGLLDVLPVIDEP